METKTDQVLIFLQRNALPSSTTFVARENAKGNALAFFLADDKWRKDFERQCAEYLDTTRKPVWSDGGIACG